MDRSSMHYVESIEPVEDKNGDWKVLHLFGPNFLIKVTALNRNGDSKLRVFNVHIPCRLLRFEGASEMDEMELADDRISDYSLINYPSDSDTDEENATDVYNSDSDEDSDTDKNNNTA